MKKIDDAGLYVEIDEAFNEFPDKQHLQDVYNGLSASMRKILDDLEIVMNSELYTEGNQTETRH